MVSFLTMNIAVVGRDIGGVAGDVAREGAGIGAVVYERAGQLQEVGAE